MQTSRRGPDLQRVSGTTFAPDCGSNHGNSTPPVTAPQMRYSLFRDPFEPPMPPGVRVPQAINMAQVLTHGEPNAGRIALTIFRNKVREFCPPAEKAERP